MEREEVEGRAGGEEETRLGAGRAAVGVSRGTCHYLLYACTTGGCPAALRGRVSYRSRGAAYVPGALKGLAAVVYARWPGAEVKVELGLVGERLLRREAEAGAGGGGGAAMVAPVAPVSIAMAASALVAVAHCKRLSLSIQVAAVAVAQAVAVVCRRRFGWDANGGCVCLLSTLPCATPATAAASAARPPDTCRVCTGTKRSHVACRCCCCCCRSLPGDAPLARPAQSRRVRVGAIIRRWTGWEE